MKKFPTIPHAREAPAPLFEGGHLWIQEKVDGAPLRFRLRETGAIEFGDRRRVYDPSDVPDEYAHAVRHVRERLDRAALRSAVDRPADVVFFGEAMHRHAVDYDWDRTPSFLGFDVWSGAADAFLPPDAVETIFRRLGLALVNTFRKEVRAVDFDPDDYDIPDSEWYDGPPEGVILRNKTGLRAKLIHPRFEDALSGEPGADAADPATADAAALARTYVTDDRIGAVVRRLESEGAPVTVDAVYERVVEAVTREHHPTLYGDRATVDVRAFRSEVAGIVRKTLDGRA